MKALYFFVTFTLLSIQSSHAQVSRAIVVEDHTGAWCGWCVRGNQAAEDLHAEYGAQLIPLAFHNDDKMFLKIQDTLAQRFKITGYPNGLLNRDAYTIKGATSVNVDPENWAEAAAGIKTAKSNIGVSVDWSINATGILTATVTAEMFLDLNTQYAFNLAIVEDSVTGTGKGWDQTNYLSGRRGYESHPYFYLPSSITNYYHMNVVRAFLGGVNGEVGTFPALAKKGSKYSYTFTVDLSTIDVQHPEHLWVAGLVVEHSGLNRIVNAASKGKIPTPKSRNWKVEIQATNNYRKVDRGDSTIFDFTLSNKNDKDVTAFLEIDASNSTLPSMWSASFEPKQVIIKAGMTETLKMKVKVGNRIGYAGYKVVANLVPFEDVRGLPVSVNVGVLSDQVRFAVAKFDLDEGRDLDPLLESYNKLIDFPELTAVINCNDSTLTHYDFNAFDVLILPESFSTRTSIIFSKKMVQMMKKRAESAKPMLITSPMNMWFTADNYGKVVNDEVKLFFNETLGFTGAKRAWGPWLWNSALGRNATVNVRSFNGQNVAADMDFIVNDIDSVYTRQDGWLDELSIIDSSRVHRILNFYGEKISDDSSVAAVYTDLRNTKAIYQGFGFEAIKDEPVRRTLLANYLGFLMANTDVKPELNAAHIVVSPNPTSDRISLRFELKHPRTTVEIVDTRGNRVRLLETHEGSGVQNLSTDVSELVSGRYFVLIHDAGVYSVALLEIHR